MAVSIAVVIPVYNASVYLDYVLESLMTQTVRADEIICVDDGSTDDSAAIIERIQERYPEGNLRLIRQANSGTAAACNAGVEVVQSDYIIILGSDDILLPTRIEEDKRDLENRPLDMLFGPSYTFAGDHRQLHFLKKKHEMNLAHIDKDPVVNGLLKKLHIPTNAATLNTGVWRKLGGYDATIAYSEDYDFWIRFFCTRPKIEYRHTPLSAYRFSADHQSKSKHLDKKILSRIQIAEKFFNNSACREYHYLKPQTLTVMYETLAHDHWAAGNMAAYRRFAALAFAQGLGGVQAKTVLRYLKSFFK